MIFLTMMPDWIESSVLRSYSVRELIQLPSMDNYSECLGMYWIWSRDCWARWISARFRGRGRSTWLVVWVTLRTSVDNPFENLQFKLFITTNEILLGFRSLQTVKKRTKRPTSSQKSQRMDRWVIEERSFVVLGMDLRRERWLLTWLFLLIF